MTVEGLGSRHPLFSVVVPIYNRAHLIGATLRSVLGQTCQDFEIIVVDDGSSDAVAEAVAAFPDPRIRFVRQPNLGAGAARNHGIDLARGRLTAFLDSDDAFLPHHLAAMAQRLDGRTDTVAYARVRALRGGGHVVKPPRAIQPGENMATYLVGGRGFVQTSSLVLPTDAARRVRYRTDVSFGDDTDFAIRLQLSGYHFTMLPDPGVNWFDGPDAGRLSNTGLQPGRFAWFEDLRPFIPARAYHGYRGWHVAKSRFPDHPLAALGLYARAVLAGAYGPKLALVVLAQILVPTRLYRRLADLTLSTPPRPAPPITHHVTET